jgi:hypothetical protein
MLSRPAPVFRCDVGDIEVDPRIVCVERFASEIELNKHRIREHPNVSTFLHKCPFTLVTCDNLRNRYKNVQGLNKHLVAKHGATIRNFPCDASNILVSPEINCEMVCASQQDLDEHKVEHQAVSTVNYKCPYGCAVGTYRYIDVQGLNGHLEEEEHGAIRRQQNEQDQAGADQIVEAPRPGVRVQLDNPELDRAVNREDEQEALEQDLNHLTL